MSIVPALRPEVVIVTEARTIWAPLSRALDREGYEVVLCRGRHEPSFDCIGAKRGTCEPVQGVAAVVVDGWLETDEKRNGIPSWHIVLQYRQMGLPVVMLIGPDGLPGPVRDEGITALCRESSAEQICAAIHAAVDADVRARAAWTVSFD